MTNPFGGAEIVRVAPDPAEYHKQVVERGDPAFVMSSHAIVEFARCPKRWKLGYESPESKAKQFGSLLDCRLFTPGQFESRYAVKPAAYPAPATHAKVKAGKIAVGDPLPWNANASLCAEWETQQEDAGKEIVGHNEMQAASGALARLEYDHEVNQLIAHSDKQVWVHAEYHDRATNLVIPVKCLIDMVPDARHEEFGKCLADFKTSISAHPRRWGRIVLERYYDVQAALYLDLYTAATAQDRTDWIHVVQENFAPFELGKFILRTESIEDGRMFYRMALAWYAQCLKANHWPGYESHGREKYNGWTFIATDPPRADLDVPINQEQEPMEELEETDVIP